LEHLHSINVVYKDIRPENILIHDDGYIQLTDFGTSRSQSLSNDQFYAVSEYIAPELFKYRTNISFSTDFW